MYKFVSMINKNFGKGFIGLRFIWQNKLTFVGGTIICLFITLSLFSSWLSPYDPTEQDFSVSLNPPSLSHPFGTDEFGRDILSRIIHGARPTLVIVLVAGFAALLVGGSAGALSGYYGGWIDMFFMRLLDVMLAFPGILLVLAIINGTGPGIKGVITAIGISSIPPFARVARGSVLATKESDYITAAKATGEKSVSIIIRYIIPNSIQPIIALTFLRMATIIIMASAISFLGFGIQPPTPEWGLMLSQAQKYIRIAPYMSIFPGLAIIIVVLGFNLLGDSLRDAMDPKLKKKLANKR
jgi:peptide/nickel transport system permease protein